MGNVFMHSLKNCLLGNVGNDTMMCAKSDKCFYYVLG